VSFNTCSQSASGIAFTALGKGNDFVGDGLFDIVGAIAGLTERGRTAQAAIGRSWRPGILD
jgi:hypothetical protein